MQEIMSVLSPSRRSVGLAAAILLLAPVGAFAQFGKFRDTPTLTNKDIQIIRKLVREGFTGKPKGTTLAWSNPASTNSGTVTLLDQFPSGGRDCRRVRYVIKPGAGQLATVRPADYVLTSCHLPDGNWKLDNQAQPDKIG